MGIIIECSVPYTLEQNGAAERSGGVLMAKAWAIQINAQLPENLWPEAIKTVAYLTNRSPSKGLEWKTPFETSQKALGLLNPKPNIAHLRTYGCHAYVMIPKEKIPRLQKMAPRAHIGYLVGYDSTNIFRV